MSHAKKTIKVTDKDGYEVVTVLERRIYMNVTDQFQQELIDYLEESPQRIILDLGMVNVMNSSALGVLILARDKILKRDGVLVVCCLTPVMQEIFERMHFDAFFTVA